jgi:hypothetical protein
MKRDLAAGASLAALLGACALLVGEPDGHQLPPGGEAGADAPADGILSGAPVTLATGQARPVGIVATESAIYWATGADGNIQKLPRSPDGGVGSPALVFHATPGPSHTTVELTDLIIDPNGVQLYAPDTMEEGCDGFYEQPIAGNMGMCTYAALLGMHRAAVDSASVYGAGFTPDGEVIISGPTPVPPTWPHHTVVFLPSAAQAMASTGANLYFAVNGDLTLVPTAGVPDGGGPIFFAHASSPITDIVVDATNVYWTTSGGEVDALAQNAPGQMPKSLASGQAQPLRLAQDTARLYWTNQGTAQSDGSVASVPKDGSDSSHAVAVGQSRPWGIAVDTHGVYWTNSGDGTVMMVAF